MHIKYLHRLNNGGVNEKKKKLVSAWDLCIGGYNKCAVAVQQGLWQSGSPECILYDTIYTGAYQQSVSFLAGRIFTDSGSDTGGGSACSGCGFVIGVGGGRSEGRRRNCGRRP